MPDVTSLDPSSPSVYRHDPNDDPEKRRASERDALAAAQKRAHGDPDKMRAIVQVQQAMRREDDQRIASNDPPRATNLDATAPDARAELVGHLRKGVADAGGPSDPPAASLSTPTLDLATRPELFTREQLETQIALTKEVQGSPFVMADMSATMQLATRAAALRQRQSELSPPMPAPSSLPDADAVLRERGKQKAFLASSDGKSESAAAHHARRAYVVGLGHEFESRVRAWEASPAGQEAAKAKLYKSLADAGDTRGCSAGDTVESLRTRLAQMSAPPPDDPNRIYMGEHGEQGTLDAIVLHEQSLKWDESLDELHAIQAGPLGAAGSLAGHAFGLSDETRRGLANLGSIGDGFALSFGVRGRETERLHEFTFTWWKARVSSWPGFRTRRCGKRSTARSPTSSGRSPTPGWRPSTSIRNTVRARLTMSSCATPNAKERSHPARGRSLPSPKGFSGGGIWRTDARNCERWTPDTTRLVAIQRSAIRHEPLADVAGEDSRWLRGTAFEHWLRMLLADLPELASEIGPVLREATGAEVS